MSALRLRLDWCERWVVSPRRGESVSFDWPVALIGPAMKPNRLSRVDWCCLIYFSEEDSMANPNKPDPNDPRLTDPLNPVPPLSTSDPRVSNPPPVAPRSSGSAWIIALVVVVLAIAAYYIFAGGGPAPSTPEQPAATEPAPAPAEPAPAPAN
jgi:hypothetical protein